jgi:hypothetical protein
MANNRAFIRFRDGREVYFAKYYPSMGWFMPHADSAAKLEAAFERSRPGESSTGEDEIELVFETHPDPKRRSTTTNPVTPS